MEPTDSCCTAARCVLGELEAKLAQSAAATLPADFSYQVERSGPLLELLNPSTHSQVIQEVQRKVSRRLGRGLELSIDFEELGGRTILFVHME